MTEVSEKSSKRPAKGNRLEASVSFSESTVNLIESQNSLQSDEKSTSTSLQANDLKSGPKYYIRLDVKNPKIFPQTNKTDQNNDSDLFPANVFAFLVSCVTLIFGSVLLSYSYKSRNYQKVDGSGNFEPQLLSPENSSEITDEINHLLKDDQKVIIISGTVLILLSFAMFAVFVWKCVWKRLNERKTQHLQ